MGRPSPLPSYLSVVPLRLSSHEVLSQPLGEAVAGSSVSSASRGAGVSCTPRRKLCCLGPSPRPLVPSSVPVPVPPVLPREVAVWVSREVRQAGEVGRGVRALGVGGRPAVPAALPASPALGCYAVSMAAASSDSTFTLI